MVVYAPPTRRGSDQCPVLDRLWFLPIHGGVHPRARRLSGSAQRRLVDGTVVVLAHDCSWPGSVCVCQQTRCYARQSAINKAAEKKKPVQISGRAFFAGAPPLPSRPASWNRGSKIGCHQASFGFVDEDDRSYWLIQQPVCQKHWFKECMLVSRTRQGLTGMKRRAGDNKGPYSNLVQRNVPESSITSSIIACISSILRLKSPKATLASGPSGALADKNSLAI